MLQGGMRAMHFAAKEGHVACLKILIIKGSDLEAKNDVRHEIVDV